VQYLTVTALTKYIKAKLEGDRHLVSVYLKGEISNFKRHSRGHLYFTLKDEESAISAIVFAREAGTVAFQPKDGDKVLVSGRISVYQPSGTYSIQVRTMEPDGIGDLYMRYEALKKALEEKGWFDASRKRPIPTFPKAIGVVTSPTGAVIQDIRNTVDRRYRLTEVILYPALVQGPGSAESIAKMIRLANRKKEVDVLIVGRGGGSLEDLWGFNEAETAQAVLESDIPVISAVGHETDVTITDFIADLRAPTPTAAAELATPNRTDLESRIAKDVSWIRSRLDQMLRERTAALTHLDRRLEAMSPAAVMTRHKESLERLDRSLSRTFAQAVHDRRRTLELLKSLLKSPDERLNQSKRALEHLTERLQTRMEAVNDHKAHRFRLQAAALSALNPLSVMDKGFALVTKEGTIVTESKRLETGDDIDLRFKDGSVRAKITGKKES
jgi:exodeoxyribonuclease VII large subunit